MLCSHACFVCSLVTSHLSVLMLTVNIIINFKKFIKSTHSFVVFKIEQCGRSYDMQVRVEKHPVKQLCEGKKGKQIPKN